MNEPLDQEYLTWLYSQVSSVKLKTPSRTYWSLLRQLFSTEFVWLIPNDDNRMEDGRDLRAEFLEERGITDADPHWLGLGCNMLEMLIALSRRLSFESDGEPRAWFWRMLDNVDLSQYNDRVYNEECEEGIDEALHMIVYRLYSPDGEGGLFPLTRPTEDQRRVELWYQICAYLQENE